VRIGVVGAGALGLTFAAALARAHDVILLARREDVAARILRDGVRVETTEDGRAAAPARASRTSGFAAEGVAVRATADPADLFDRAACLIAVKAYATTDAVSPLRDVLSPGTLVATVQNGIDNGAAIASALPHAVVLEAVTNQGAILLSDGRVRAVNNGTTVFGRRSRFAAPAGAGDAPGDRLASAFAEAGIDARAVDDIAPLLWRKLIANAAINPLGALTGRANGAVLDDTDLAALARTLAAEAAAVAAAEGIDAGDPWSAVEAAARPTASNRNSMLQDLDAGRRTEIDAIGGAILRRARERGIAVPLTEAVTRLVRARERA